MKSYLLFCFATILLFASKSICFVRRTHESDLAHKLDRLFKEHQPSFLPKRKQNNLKQELLLSLKFAHDFSQWNPRGRDGHRQWEWYGTGSNHVADNAAFIVHQPATLESADAEQQKNAYDKKHKIFSVEEAEDDGYVDMISAPFTQYAPADELVGANQTYFEGYVKSKTNYAIGPTQRFLVRMKFSCKTVNVDQNANFTAEQSMNPWDDPRLANCGFLVDAGQTRYYYSVTNKGVWAVYQRVHDDSSGALPFTAKRRVAPRSRYDVRVDAAIEIDNRQKVVNYYVNGYRVWTIHAVGYPPPNDGNTEIAYGRGKPKISHISSVTIGFGTSKCLDESDPNNLDSVQRLVRVAPLNSTKYVNDKFFDNKGTRASQVWGQGAIMRLIKLLVIRAESGSLVQTGPMPQNEHVGGGRRSVAEPRARVIFS